MTSFFFDYLANSLWQVPLITLAVWLAARAARRLGPAIEHRIWAAALALCIVLPACAFDAASFAHTFWWRMFSHNATGQNAHITITTTATYTNGALHLSPKLFAAILVLYAVITIFFATRFAYGLLQTHRLRSRSRSIVLSPFNEQLWHRCRQLFHAESTTFAESSMIHGPVTIGIFSRLLLFPSGWPQQLSEEDFTAALAHECAHIARRDFAKNLFYEVASLPIAYHPLLRFIRSRLAATREMLCDEAAANALAGKQQYARSLLRLASLLASQPRRQTLHAIGIFDANNLETRIMNLTLKSPTVKTTRKLLTAAACLALGLGTCASALALRMNVATPADEAQTDAASPAPASKKIVKVSGGIMAGQILTRVDPIYPPDAKAAGVQGAVVLRAAIGKDGTIKQLRVASGPAELQKSALDAVKQWVYKPYLLNGSPTAVDTTITVNYQLQH